MPRTEAPAGHALAAVRQLAYPFVKPGQVAVVIVNAQAGGAETDRVEQEAKDAGIPTLRFSELLPEGKTYLSWMADNVRQLGDALE